MLRFAVLLSLLVVNAPSAVRKVEIATHDAVLDGRSFGKVGPYERITGKVYFGAKPGLPANRIIRDLESAALNSSGEAEYVSDFYILKPRDPAKGNGTILFEVSNRGGKGMLSRFNFARGSADPHTEQDFGDAWLLDQGYTLVWLGWEWDIPASARASLRFSAPHFRPGVSTDGLVRSEFITDRPVTSMPLGDRNLEPIPVQRPVAMFVRETVDATPRQVPPEQWALSPDGNSVGLAAGFAPGKLYEFVYRGKDPVVAGTGLAAVRDWISFLKYGGPDTALGKEHENLKRAIGFGISQSGRFLREFLYDGFNADEEGRRVFDGVWADVAGAGRGSFNFRYAQPSRDGHPFLNIFYPTDVFPFTDGPEVDPVTGAQDSLLKRARDARVVPRIFFTNNSYEYWGRAAALIHVSADGKHDAAPSPELRYYFIAAVQHGPHSLPLAKSGTRYDINPLDHRPVQRALLAALLAWVADGTLPPASTYPKLSAGQLTTRDKLRFPNIEGVLVPQRPRPARRMDQGPQFLVKGIISGEPPQVNGAFPVLMPQVDADGIDLGGIRLPEVAVPVATITGWNLRAPGRGAPEEMAEFSGSIFPFPKTREDRLRMQDPRLSIAERYAGREDYAKKVAAAADEMISSRFLLRQDRAFAIERAMRLWDALVTSTPAAQH